MTVKPLQLKQGVLAILTLVFALPAHAARWHSVQAVSQLEFVASYEGAEAPGRFSKFDVVMSFDPVLLSAASLLVDVDITSANMGNPDMDKAIAAPEWFNAQAFPHARFHSDTIKATGHSEYLAQGTVSIKGRSHPASVPFHWRSYARDAEISGALTLSRSDFDVGTGKWASDSPIGHTVQVRFKIALKADE